MVRLNQTHAQLILEMVKSVAPEGDMREAIVKTIEDQLEHPEFDETLVGLVGKIISDSNGRMRNFISDQRVQQLREALFSPAELFKITGSLSRLICANCNREIPDNCIVTTNERLVYCATCIVPEYGTCRNCSNTVYIYDSMKRLIHKATKECEECARKAAAKPVPNLEQAAQDFDRLREAAARLGQTGVQTAAAPVNPTDRPTITRTPGNTVVTVPANQFTAVVPPTPVVFRNAQQPWRNPATLRRTDMPLRSPEEQQEVIRALQQEAEERRRESDRQWAGIANGGGTPAQPAQPAERASFDVETATRQWLADGTIEEGIFDETAAVDERVWNQMDRGAVRRDDEPEDL
jgi:hypothetical protein